MNKTTDVLIVDDEVHILTALRRALHGESYRTYTVDNAEEALTTLGEREFAVIISDYRMPDMDGVTFLQRAKEIRPDSVRIILSGYADISAVIDGVNRGEIFKFVAKPWNDEELKLTIAQSLDHWHLLKSIHDLAHELMLKNVALSDLNAHLEQEVERRSRDLFLKDRRYLLAQFILEHLPVAVLGVDENDMIALANRRADALWPSPSQALVGSSYQRVFDEKMSLAVSSLRRESKEAAQEIMIGERRFDLHFKPISLNDTTGNDLITLVEREANGKGRSEV